MTEFIFILITFGVVTQCLAPRLFAHFDAKMARQRLAPTTASSSGRGNPSQMRTPAEHLPSRQPLDAATCEALARATRAGLTAGQALERTLGTHDMTPEGRHMVDPLLDAALVDGNFDPAALDVVATILRDRVSCEADTAVAVAQASLSVRVLTVVPFAGIAFFSLLSSRFRTILMSPGMFTVVTVGLVLNWIGRTWMRSLITRIHHRETETITTLIDQLCVSLRAGYPLTAACERLGGTGQCGTSIRSNLMNGRALEVSLLPLVEHFGPDGQQFADLIVAAHRDGQPLLATIDRLATESRATRRRVTDTRIRQLPGKMAAPLVACVLPSFILLSVAPLVFISVGRLTNSLPLTQP